VPSELSQGPQLSIVYDKWGARLLESNVLSFLQARGKMNQGIRDTIKPEPTMFFRITMAPRRRLTAYSRRVLAPAIENTNRETKRFYERARG